MHWRHSALCAARGPGRATADGRRRPPARPAPPSPSPPLTPRSPRTRARSRAAAQRAKVNARAKDGPPGGEGTCRDPLPPPVSPAPYPSKNARNLRRRSLQPSKKRARRNK
ncbi:unnamed protein product, partial [Brenthis ino]